MCALIFCHGGPANSDASVWLPSESLPLLCLPACASRQIAVFGLETMGALIKLKVLIVGVKGVGVEIAKNLILAGPKAVTLADGAAACPFLASP